MSTSSSSAARAFDRSSRTAADLRAFWKEAPQAAATWLAEVAAGSANPPADLAALCGAKKLAATPDALVELVRSALDTNPQLFDTVGAALATAQAQDRGAPRLGWSATSRTPPPQPEPPSFVGTLQKTEAGVIQLKTALGVFDMDLGHSAWREELETAFLTDSKGAPQVVTVKGFPSADGARLYAKQFAPGATDAFVAGRVRVHDGKVWLQTEADLPPEVYMLPPEHPLRREELVEITHPELIALLQEHQAQGLASFDKAGVILPGAITTDATGKKVYASLPEAMWVLGRTMKLNVGSDGVYDFHDLDTGYFKATQARSAPGLAIPPQSKPGGATFAETDKTRGDLKPGEGARAFFYAKLLPHEAPTASVEMPRPTQRRIELLAVSDQGDQGHHSVGANTQLSYDFGVVARAVPAAAPSELAESSRNIDPTDD